MATTLTGNTIQTTYDSLIKVGDNTVINGSLKELSDGVGTAVPLEISTAAMSVTAPLTTVDQTINGNIEQKLATSTTYYGDLLDIGLQLTSPAPTVGKVYYLNSSGLWLEADNTALASSNSLLCIVVTTGVTDPVLVKGTMGNALYSAFSTASPLYIGVGGLMTETPPTATGTFVRQVGYAVQASANLVYFNPDFNFFENT